MVEVGNPNSMPDKNVLILILKTGLMEIFIGYSWLPNKAGLFSICSNQNFTNFLLKITYCAKKTTCLTLWSLCLGGIKQTGGTKFLTVTFCRVLFKPNKLNGSFTQHLRSGEKVELDTKLYVCSKMFVMQKSRYLSGSGPLVSLYYIFWIILKSLALCFGWLLWL